jgi:DNA replication protein DnaC
LRSARATGTYERRFQQLANVPLLICDDFEVKPLRSPEDVHDLIAERYEVTTTVLMSDRDFGEWGEPFASNKMIGPATLDRLCHDVYRVVFDADSCRSFKLLQETPKTAVAKQPKIVQSCPRSRP